MNLWTIARYLVGDSRAIRSLAGNSAALPVGIVLVLLTAVARNYDQTFIAETPLWLFGSLLFSFFSGSFLFLILYRFFIQRCLEADPLPSKFQQWRTFMGLFWMTAPIAWLYAIPVERWLESNAAAQANLTLLAIVSVWRVVLMSRVVSVVNGVPFARALGWVTVVAALEVIIVVFLGGLFSPTFGNRIMAGMSGLRNAPEENLILSALSNAWMGAWALLIIIGITLTVRLYQGTTQPFPRARPGRGPWLSLGVLAVLWMLLAWPAQLEQQRFHRHAKLIDSKQYAAALSYLAQHRPADFPPSRRLEPSPYEYRVWDELPPVIALLTTNTPLWIRERYLGHASATFIHRWLKFRHDASLSAMFAALEQLPDGRQWILTNQIMLVNSRIIIRPDYRTDSDEEQSVRTNLLGILRRVGVAETNLNELAK